MRSPRGPFGGSFRSAALCLAGALALLSSGCSLGRGHTSTVYADDSSDPSGGEPSTSLIVDGSEGDLPPDCSPDCGGSESGPPSGDGEDGSASGGPAGDSGGTGDDGGGYVDDTGDYSNG